MPILKEMDYLKFKTESLKDNEGVFVLDPLLPGYGVTLGNAIRRVALSSIEGNAITSIKINNVTHEFSSIKGVKEDVIEIILNLKQLRMKKFTNDPVTIKLSVSGAKKVSAKDFKKNADIEIIDPEQPIATLDKGAKLEIEAVVETGKGYLPTENRDSSALEFGMIAIDANFTPIRKISFDVENTRVGQDTNYDKLILSISSDGSVTPDVILSKSCQVICEHLNVILENISQPEKKKATKKTTKKTK
ncbi:MAG: DNA-directed RNA polymerase subunit alpha [Berkelbacteria bacterium GW2011_GWA2_35_9]|uniref:DNA-directed RNA polymerase subunit alpha n=1 Tax=Berkelbacteria bacterium GW2011_GWA2_35_9 TaxID=1618333 RepID=A0A0G0GBZ4_9BACT|nr:MAG: DNA-directed RNA polymerase subunit alpha [Berkelbacteria bacterium GW2011_GWA2_35_9]